jgi:hypothetical protein
MLWGMRRALVLLLALATAGFVGCAAQPRGSAVERRPVARGGWARLGPGVHLRSDTPSLSTVLAPPEEPAPAPRDFGPRGDEGETSHGMESSGTTYLPSPYPAYGTLDWARYGAPGGAVPPGLREPTDKISPYAGPYLNAFPASDVAVHRPGLSSGAAIYGRQDLHTGR